MRPRLGLLAILVLAAAAPAQLKPSERDLLTESLVVAGVRADELAVPLAPGGPLAREARRAPAEAFDALTLFAADLFGPLGAVRDALATQASAQSRPGAGNDRTNARAAARGGLDSSAPAAPDSTAGQNPATPSVASDLPLPVRRLAAAVARANGEIRAALARLSPAERRLLIEGLPTLAGRTAGLRPTFAASDLDLDGVRAARAKLDASAIRDAGVRLARAADAEWAALRTLRFEGARRILLGGVVVVLAGEGAGDLDARDAGLVVVAGGNGRITGRAGAGIGYASLLLDLRSRAEIVAPDAGPGTGLLGIGIARFAGEVEGKAGLLAFGAGVAGYGEFRAAGPARLEARAMAEGFGDAEGLGLLVTGAERDELRLGAWGQGAGRDGGIGALVDAGGDDRYEAPGVAPDEAIGGRESAAQGYGEGGGVGVLADAGGDDAYALSARGQGAGVDGGLGLLFDAAGNDDRRAFGMAQGAADRSGVGALADGAGDDTATIRRGEGQASATRGGVALLLDRSGDDLYAQGIGSPGSAEGGAVALFLDAGGADAVTGRLAPASDGSVSLLILGGSARGVEPELGGPFGASATGGGASRSEDGPAPPEPGSLRPDAARIARAVTLLETRRGGYREAGVRELTAFGAAGVEAALARVDRFDEDALDGLARLIGAVGEPARRLAIARIGPAPSGNGLRLAGMARLSLPGSSVAAALDDPLRRKAAILALADGLSAPEAAGLVLPAVLDEDREIARAAMRALLRIGGAAEESSVRALVTTGDPTVRAMAWSFVARRPGAVEFAKGLLGDNDPLRVVAGVGILAAEGGEEALRLAGSGLNAPTREVRIAALRALSGRVPSAWRPRVIELQSDADPAVRRAAAAARLGA